MSALEPAWPSRMMRILIAATLACLATLALSPGAAQAGSTFSRHLLKIRGSEQADQIEVVCSESGTVLINGRAPNLMSGGPLPCERVTEIDVIARGGSDRVDLDGVDASFGAARFDGFGRGTLTAILGGAGDDLIICGDAFCFVPSAGPGRDVARGGPLRDILRGGADNDRISGGEGRDELMGRGGNDFMDGGVGADLVSGNGGGDQLYGRVGPDLIGGGSGDDFLDGGLGNDHLFGGLGRDRILGGAGKNKIVQDPPRPRGS